MLSDSRALIAPTTQFEFKIPSVYRIVQTTNHVDEKVGQHDWGSHRSNPVRYV